MLDRDRPLARVLSRKRARARARSPQGIGRSGDREIGRSGRGERARARARARARFGGRVSSLSEVRLRGFSLRGERRSSM